MELFGRLTADATVKTTKNEKKVVHFTLTMNDRYKTKDSSKWKNVATYVNCSYWLGEGVTKILTKGALIEIYGRLSVNAWNNKDGEARASLEFHVNSLKLHSKGNAGLKDASQTPADNKETVDDLPF